MSASGIVYRLVRGPLIVTVVIISFFYPHLQSCLLGAADVTTLLRAFLALAGIHWFLHDLCKATQQVARTLLNNALNAIVLDNVLRGIYDPERGLLACLTGLFVGTSTMYGLRMKEQQRIKLVQSSLGMSVQEAHKVLMEPGGCKLLLSETIQLWLASQQDISDKNLTNSNDNSEHVAIKALPKNSTLGSPSGNSSTGDVSIDATSSECEMADIEDEHNDGVFCYEEKVERARGLSFSGRPIHCAAANEDFNASCNQQKKRHHFKRSSTQPRSEEKGAAEANPIAVFSTILKDMALEQIRPYAESFPRSTVENVGVAAAAIVGMQLIFWRFSKRHRIFHRLFTFSVSTVIAASFGSILTREVVLGNIYDKESLEIACVDMLVRVFGRVKRNIMFHKTKSFLAMAILILLGRKEPRRTSSSGGLRP
jgi:multisubunit Na+/H+ antiporter MnhE subunit